MYSTKESFLGSVELHDCTYQTHFLKINLTYPTYFCLSRVTICCYLICSSDGTARSTLLHQLPNPHHFLLLLCHGHPSGQHRHSRTLQEDRRTPADDRRRYRRKADSTDPTRLDVTDLSRPQSRPQPVGVHGAVLTLLVPSAVLECRGELLSCGAQALAAADGATRRIKEPRQ